MIVKLFCAGQKYLLQELRRQLAQLTTISQLLQNQLASFDRRTRNYTSSLTTELAPSIPNSTGASARVASTPYPPDVLIEFSPSASRTANNGNQHLPAVEVNQSENNVRSANLASAGQQSADGTPWQGESPRSDYSDDDSQASMSPSIVEYDTPRYLSVIDEVDDDDLQDHDAPDFHEDERDLAMRTYSDDDNSVDEEYQSRGYEEYDDSDVSDSDSVQQSPEHIADDVAASVHGNVQRGTGTPDDIQQLPSVNEDDDDHDEDDDILQSWQPTDRTSTSLSHTTREPHCGVETDAQPEYAVIENESEQISEEQERITVRLRVNSHRSEGSGLSGDADAGTEVAANHHPASRSLSGIESADDDDVSQDEDEVVAHRGDVTDDELSLSDYDYDHSPRHYRSTYSSSSASRPASPSLHDDSDDQVHSPAHSHYDSRDDDSDAERSRRNSRESTPSDDIQTSSQRQNLQSRSRTSQEQNSNPASPALSAEVSGHSSPMSWMRSDSADSYRTVSEDSEDSWSLAGRRGVKRRRRRSASTSSDTDDDMPDTNGSHHRRKLHRFR